MLGSRNAKYTIHARFDDKLSTLAYRARLDHKSLCISISDSQSTPVHNDIGQYQRQDSYANYGFRSRAAGIVIFANTFDGADFWFRCDRWSISCGFG